MTTTPPGPPQHVQLGGGCLWIPWRDYIFELVWDHLGVPPEAPPGGNVAGGVGVWALCIESFPFGLDQDERLMMDG